MLNIIKNIIDFLFPRQCTICGKRLAAHERGLCVGCMFDLQPSEFADGHHGNKLERIFWHKIPIVRAAAYLVYDHEKSQRKIILDLKYHNRPKLARHIAPLLLNELKTTGFLDEIDLIMPVPIPMLRKIKRGYNQSQQLAKAISRHTGIPVDNLTVRRKNYTKSQTKVSIGKRAPNIKHTFVVTSGRKLDHKHILIVDDVITTGSTILAMAKTLCNAYNVKISVLSLAVSTNLMRNIKTSNPITPGQ